MGKETGVFVALALLTAVALGTPSNQTSNRIDNLPLSRWSPGGLFGKWTPADEVVSLRSENSKTFDNHDGTFSLVMSGAIHRQNRQGNWAEIEESVLDGGTRGDSLPTDDTTRIYIGPGIDNHIWGADVPYFRVQFLYLSTELLFNGHIVSLGFFSDGQGLGGDTMENAQHWISDVSYSTFSSSDWSSPGQTTWGPGTLALPDSGAGWTRLPMGTPYTHIHGNNLLVSYQHAKPNVERTAWYRYHSVGVNRGKRGRSNTTNPPPMTAMTTRPDIEIIYIPIYPDMQTTSIAAPKDTVVSGQNYTPQAVVRNNGPVPAVRLSVAMNISTGYSDSRTLTDKAVGSLTTVSFNTWNAATLGDFAVRCSTRLDGDSVPENNKSEATGFVRRLDVQTTVIVSPTASVDSGYAITPEARFRNNGNTTVSFEARFSVNSAYTSTSTVTNLAPAEERSVPFAEWTPSVRGSSTARCTTLLAGDQVSSNNRFTQSVFTRVLDALPVSIIAPGAVVDSGQSTVPQVLVRNGGNTTVSFDVRLHIGDDYADVQNVNLNAGAQTTVSFRNWIPVQRGIHSVACTTMLTDDMVSTNDVKSGVVRVSVQDVGIVGIVEPRSSIPSGTYNPQVTVRNFGTVREPVTVTVSVDCNPPYRQTVACPDGLPLDADTLIAFPEWNALPGHYEVRCSTYMAGDQVSLNDTASLVIDVGVVDVGVTAIIAPVGQVETAATVVPSVQVGNFGGQAATFTAWFRIEAMDVPIYERSMTVTELPAGAKTTLVFDTWPKPHAYGTYVTRCSTYVAGDQDPGNDVVTDQFIVTRHAGRYGWRVRSDMPPLPSSKPVAKGGWLTIDAGSDLAYGAKGNKTGDFYSYNPRSDYWQRLRSIPNGREGKSPSTGAVGAATGDGFVYATKGNNTSGFWRYSAKTDSWTQMADVPLGSSKKKVKGGSTMIAVGGQVYLLKGGKSEFLCYSPANDSWKTLSLPAAGTSAKWDLGSWLATDGGSTIYAHKSKHHDFYKYSVTSDSWRKLDGGMPLLSSVTGKQKKSKDGGCGTWMNGAVYALKGGNSQEFWSYHPAGDSWKELDTMPSVGTNLKRKRVKSGAGIIASSGLIYALKGNKTSEFWVYVFPPVSKITSIGATRVGVAAADRQPASSTLLSIGPNPLTTGRAMLTIDPRAVRSARGSIQVAVYDASGRSVWQSAVNRQKAAVAIDLQSVPAGVYLLKVCADNFTAAQKLVIQR